MSNRINIINIGDPGKDLDDELSFITYAGLEDLGYVKLLGVVANLEPALERAKLAKGTFVQLGMSYVPVGIGTDCFKGGENLKHETDAPYATTEDELYGCGNAMMIDLLSNSTEKVTIVCNSGLTDIVRLITSRPDLVISKVQELVIMGGVKCNKDDNGVSLATVAGPDKVQYLVPDDAANNAFDWAAAQYVYQWAQEHKVPLVVIMRWAPYACQFPFAHYDSLAQTGSAVGANLLSRQKPSINQLWAAANSEAGSPVRGKLPMSRDRAWFVKTFCKGIDPGVGGQEEVWPFVDSFNQYDPMAVLAAVPKLRDRFYTHHTNEVKGVFHKVIGPHESAPGIVDVNDLRTFMTNLQINALKN